MPQSADNTIDPRRTGLEPDLRATADSSGQTLDEPTSARLTALARALKAAARAVSLYPPEHPAIGNAFGRLLEAGEAATGTGPFAIDVQPEALSVGGLAPARPEAALGDLAALLHQLSVGRLIVQPDITADDWQQFLRLIITSPEAVRAQGGAAADWAAAGGQHIELRELDYAEMLREKRGAAPIWDQVIEAVLKGDALNLDDDVLAELADMAADPAKFVAFVRRVESLVTGPGATRARAAVLKSVLDRIISFLRSRDPGRLDTVLDNTAQALGQLPDEVVAALVVKWAESGSDPERGAILEEIAERTSPATAGRLVARSVAAHGGATRRLADVFHCLVRTQEDRHAALDLAREELEQLPLASEPGFKELWERTAELLGSQPDRSWVSQAYDHEISSVRLQAVDMDKIADDPPERVAAWLDTVTTTALRALDVQLLLDFLRLDLSPQRWRETARAVVAHVDDLILIGDFTAARRLVEGLTAQANTPADPDRVQWVIAAIDTLVGGQALGHLRSHLQTIANDEFEEVKRLSAAIGAILVTPLAEAVATEEHARVRQRLTELLLAFGTEGRRAVERLVESANPAVRRTAVQLLRQFGGREALPNLTALLNDRELQVRREAVRAVLTIGSDEAYTALQQALTSGEPRARDAVLDELSTFRDERAVPLFCFLVCQPDHHRAPEDLSLMAVARLGSLGGSLAAETLKTVLYRGEWWAPRRTARFREAAARALARIGSGDSRQVLDEAAARGSRGVRAAARRVRVSDGGS